MSGHEGFTIKEATTTEAGRIRGVILDTVALRVGQVPNLHPRLLEGIEVAARLLADTAGTPTPEAVDVGAREALAEAVIDRCSCGHYPGDHHIDTGCHHVVTERVSGHVVRCACSLNMPEASAEAILASDWLAAREAAAEKQGAEKVLREMRRLAVRCYPRGLVATKTVIADLEEFIVRATESGRP